MLSSRGSSDLEIKSVSLMSPALAGGFFNAGGFFFTTGTTWEALFSIIGYRKMLNIVPLSRSLLVIYFMHSNVYMLIPTS